MERVLRAIRKDRNRHAWHLALSGLRRGEIGGLRWTNVDLVAKTLTIGATPISVDGKAVEQDGAKSEDSERTLPIPDPLLVELKAAKKRQASEKLTLGAAYADLGYVVCNKAGQPYHPDTLSKMWAKAIANAGAPHIRLHDARHTCGTTMHLQNVPGRGDRGMAGSRRHLFHDAHICALTPGCPGRRRADFGTSCDNS